MFHEVDGQQRPPFCKGKSSFSCPQKVFCPSSEQHTKPCPKCINVLCMRLATPALLCSVGICLEVFSRMHQRIHTGPLGNYSSLQAGCISSNGAISCAVPVVGCIFSPRLLIIWCAQWCSLSIIFCRITEDSAVTTFEALKARVRELERQLSRGDRYKCLICMVSIIPLVVMNQKCLGYLCWGEEKLLSFFRWSGGTHLCPYTPISLLNESPLSSWNLCVH